jgi:uncharacterized tellurite resistance protein B-like protein
MKEIIMSEKQKKHPLQDYEEKEQIAYFSILASMCYVDKDFGDEEKKQLDSLLTEFNISDEGKGQIYASVFSMKSDDRTAYVEILNNLKDADLRFTLISDICLLAYIDDDFSEEEYKYILEMGESLDINKEQVDAIKSVQENLRKIKDIPQNSERYKNVIKDSASKLASAGVPTAAIAISGSVFGLSAAGLASGLAALGALVGGGMLAGAVIVVPAIAIGSAYGVKKLIDLVWKDKKK